MIINLPTLINAKVFYAYQINHNQSMEVPNIHNNVLCLVEQAISRIEEFFLCYTVFYWLILILLILINLLPDSLNGSWL